jgi:hypothetical protein
MQKFFTFVMCFLVGSAVATGVGADYVNKHPSSTLAACVRGVCRMCGWTPCFAGPASQQWLQETQLVAMDEGRMPRDVYDDLRLPTLADLDLVAVDADDVRPCKFPHAYVHCPGQACDQGMTVATTGIDVCDDEFTFDRMVAENEFAGPAEVLTVYPRECDDSDVYKARGIDFIEVEVAGGTEFLGFAPHPCQSLPCEDCPCARLFDKVTRVLGACLGDIDIEFCLGTKDAERCGLVRCTAVVNGCQKQDCCAQARQPGCCPLAVDSACRQCCHEAACSPEEELETKLGKKVCVNYQATPFCQVLDDFRDRFGLNIVCDEATFRAHGVCSEMPVNCRLDNVSARTALALVLKNCGLSYTTVENVVVVTVAQSNHPKTVRQIYPLKDFALSCSNFCEQELVRVLMATIEPASWNVMGGPGHVEYYPLGMCLIVNQTEEVHQQIQEMLDLLRSMTLAQKTPPGAVRWEVQVDAGPENPEGMTIHSPRFEIGEGCLGQATITLEKPCSTFHLRLFGEEARTADQAQVVQPAVWFPEDFFILANSPIFLPEPTSPEGLPMCMPWCFPVPEQLHNAVHIGGLKNEKEGKASRANGTDRTRELPPE